MLNNTQVAERFKQLELSSAVITSILDAKHHEDFWGNCTHGALMMYMLETIYTHSQCIYEPLSDDNKAILVLKCELAEMVEPYIEEEVIKEIFSKFQAMVAGDIRWCKLTLTAMSTAIETKFSWSKYIDYSKPFDEWNRENIPLAIVASTINLATRPYLDRIYDGIGLVVYIQYILEVITQEKPTRLTLCSKFDKITHYTKNVYSSKDYDDNLGLAIQHVCADIIRKHFPNLEDII